MLRVIYISFHLENAKMHNFMSVVVCAELRILISQKYFGILGIAM